MSKRLCKFDRREIASSLGEIHQLVMSPRYVCRSCARSAHQPSSVCKPLALPVDAEQAVATDSPKKKWLKKQKKAAKKVKKLMKKQAKLKRKSQKIENKMAQYQPLMGSESPAESFSPLH